MVLGKYTKLLTFAMFTLLMLLGVWLYWRFNEIDPKAIAIMEVGDETLYQSDLEYELIHTPPLKNIDINRFIHDKLIKDSIMLQAAQKDKIIVLTPQTYNDQNKDYSQRIQAIRTIEEHFKESANSLQGEFAVAWFFNNDSSGGFHYETSKRIVKEKVDQVHKQVFNQEIDLIEAANIIKNDVVLKQIDPAIESNAFFSFSVEGSSPITADPAIDETLRKLPTGELSQVLTLKAPLYDGPETIEAAYLFGIVTKKETSYSLPPIEEWFEKNKDEYQITIH